MSETLSIRLAVDAIQGRDRDADLAALRAAPMFPADPFEMGRWETPALMAQDVTFAPHVHAETSTSTSWFDGDCLLVAATLVSFRTVERGLSRLHRFLDAVAAAGRAPDGRIVGGWQTSHLPNTMPILWKDGRPLLGFGSGDPDRKPYVDFAECPATIDPDSIEASEDGLHAIVRRD